MIRVQRDKSKELTVAVAHGANSLAQTHGVDPGAVGRLQVPDRLPAKATMPVELVPWQRAESAQTGDGLAQLAHFKVEENVLKLRTVEIELHALRSAARGFAALA